MLPKDPIIATATAVAIAAARHSPPPWSLRGFILVVVVVVFIVTAITTVFPPLFCDLFDCRICSVVVSSPLPHPVAIVVGVWIRPRHHHYPSAVGNIGIGRHGVSSQVVRTCPGVINIELTVGGVVGVEGHAQEALLIAR